MVATVMFLALVLAVGVTLWAAMRRDIDSVVSGGSIAALMAALLSSGPAVPVLAALGILLFLWWAVRRVTHHIE